MNLLNVKFFFFTQYEKNKIVYIYIYFFFIYKWISNVFIKSPKVLNKNNKYYYKITILKSSNKFKQKFIFIKSFIIINNRLIDIFESIIDLILLP